MSLLGVKLTLGEPGGLSANDPKRHSRVGKVFANLIGFHRLCGFARTDATEF